MRWFIVAAKFCKFLSWTTVDGEGKTRDHGLYRLVLDREEKDPYLHRYYLINTRWIKWIFPKLSYRIVLHHTVKSDVDGLHDHPWPWKSRLVSGGYWEDTPDGKFWREPSQGWRTRTGEDFHRLIIDEEMANGEETWSLFVMGPRYKEWGFLAGDGSWIPWEEYIDNRDLYA